MKNFGTVSHARSTRGPARRRRTRSRSTRGPRDRPAISACIRREVSRIHVIGRTAGRPAWSDPSHGKPRGRGRSGVRAWASRSRRRGRSSLSIPSRAVLSDVTRPPAPPPCVAACRRRPCPCPCAVHHTTPMICHGSWTDGRQAIDRRYGPSPPERDCWLVSRSSPVHGNGGGADGGQLGARARADNVRSSPRGHEGEAPGPEGKGSRTLRLESAAVR